MDPEVWKHLADHEEILRLVLARLSWDSNRRLRSVSKAWNATLSEPSFLTWGSMLTDRNFYSDHRDLKWIDSFATDSVANSSAAEHHLERSRAEAVCLLSTSQQACAVANIELHRWFKLPPLQQLPFGQWDEFTVSGAAEGLLLLERRIRDRSQDLYKLDRFLVNPVTNEYVKLLSVPKSQRSFDGNFPFLRHPMILTVDKDKFVKVVAAEFSLSGGAGMAGTKLRKIWIWRQHSMGWEPVDIDAVRLNTIPTLDHAVYAGGELFLHTKYMEDASHGHRIIKCENHAVDLNLDFLDQYSGFPILHLFQHRGVLMCVIRTWKGDHTACNLHRRVHYIRLCKFDHANGRWLHDSMIDMPRSMVQRLYNTLPDGGVWRFYVDIEGDTLCVGNRMKAEAFFLYNFLSHEWCACSSVEYQGQNENNQEIFLWSPKIPKGASIQS